ncbi:cytochrome P450 2A9-like [Oppia nitens]|uniref:cytochrome P450 2A9-like n=1 Tax=Oppia nitens TaxID=1686743 RepID=UPI0023DB0593|nr:cytochrome P450 2A9-like [Oppia nitens]
MFLWTQIISFYIITHLWTLVLSLTIGYLVYKLAMFYHLYYSLPPGPFPLPVIGNMLTFQTKTFWDDIYRQLSEKYGPVFTVYMGNTPQVMISDADIARQVFSKTDFAGRPKTYFATLLANDVMMDDYGNSWEALRRVAHTAAMKYSINERLVNVAVDCVDKTVELMLKREGPDKPIKPVDYIYLIFLNIMTNSAFNESYNFDDIVFKKFKYVLKDIFEEMNLRLMLTEYIKPLQWIDYKLTNKMSNAYNEMRDIIYNKFKQHYIDYDREVERDFCDALIAAKDDALREGRESAPYLTDDKLGMTVFDMFFAGIETSEKTFQWILLLLSYYPRMQKRLRDEIISQIGDRLPRHQDRQQCHYVMAFIAETLRFRNVAPYGLPHRSIITSKIGNYTIPKGITVYTYQGIILKNSNDKHWTNGDHFLPDRFIDSDGHYITTHSPAFMPFGVGRRKCLGEKLAIADLFLVLVRFIQLTQNYDIILDSHRDLSVDPNSGYLINPNE